MGVLLYELCALAPPFTATSLQFLALKIVKGSYTSLTGNYSKELKNLVSDILQYVPNKRPSVSDILSRYLFIKTNHLLKRESKPFWAKLIVKTNSVIQFFIIKELKSIIGSFMSMKSKSNRKRALKRKERSWKKKSKIWEKKWWKENRKKESQEKSASESWNSRRDKQRGNNKKEIRSIGQEKNNYGCNEKSKDNSKEWELIKKLREDGFYK